MTPQRFVHLAREQFDFLISDFQFSVQDKSREGWVLMAEVIYDSPKLSITPGWDSRDGLLVTIRAKQDTFWIGPASSHTFDLFELLQMVAPEALTQVPVVSWPEESEAEVETWLAFAARQLRDHGQGLLKGDLALCEDMLITRYCNSSKGLPLDEYFRFFREHCAGLSLAEREQLDAAMATRSPRQVYFVLQDWINAGHLRGEQFLNAMNDFRVQYFQ